MTCVVIQELEEEEIVVVRGSRVAGSAVQVLRSVNARETLTAANGWDSGVMQKDRDKCNRV